MSSLDDEGTLPRSLVEAWRADRPSPGELRQGYGRFIRAQRPRRRALGLVYWVMAGTLLGAGLAQAATSSGWPAWLGLERPLQPAPGVRSHPAPGAAPTVNLATPSPSVVVEPTPSAPSVPQAPVPGRAAAGSPLSAPPESQLPEQWQHAARGLREQDFAKAHQALLEIERSARGGERDAARLAHAQLLSSHGRTAEAERLLRELAQHAQSELVRGKARALLTRPSEIVSPDRSVTPPGDTQQP